MPEKILIADDLIDNEGSPCALGVMFKSRGISSEGIDIEDSRHIGKLLNISRPMAAEIEYINDECSYRDKFEHPTLRWLRVRAWVDENLLDVIQ